MEKNQLRNQFLFEEGSDFIFTWDQFEEALSFHDPRGPYYFVKDPTPVNLYKMMHPYVLTFGGGYMLTRMLDPTNPMTWTAYKAHKWDMTVRTARAIGVGAARTAYVSAYVGVPVAIAAGTTYAYEKKVNEPIRRSHPGSQGTWFGPFGSGFGTVV